MYTRNCKLQTNLRIPSVLGVEVTLPVLPAYSVAAGCLDVRGLPFPLHVCL
jgi:hypothetical protein